MFTQCVVRGSLEKWPRRQEFWDWHYWHRILRGFNDQKINGRIPSNVVGLIQQKSFVNSTSLVITELHCKNIVVTLCFHDWLIWGKIFRKPWKHHGKYGTYRETMVCTIYIYICPCKCSLKPILFGFSPVSESGCIMLYDIWNPHVLLVQPSIVSPVFADICNPLLCLLVRFTQGIFGNDPSHHW